MRKTLFVSAAAAAVLAGCGSSSAGGEDGIFGYYLDNAVEGVHYKCGKHEGYTDKDGKFEFDKGDSCTFDVAGIPLRNIPAEKLEKGMKFVEDNVQVARLLQSIDADGDLSNGIQISKEVIEALQEAVDNLKKGGKKAKDVVGDEGALREVVGKVGEKVKKVSGEVVSEEDAKKHIDSTKQKVNDEKNKNEFKNLKKAHLEKDGIIKTIKSYFAQAKKDKIENEFKKYEHDIKGYENLLDRTFKKVKAQQPGATISQDCDDGGSVTVTTAKDGNIITGSMTVNQCKVGQLTANGKLDAKMYRAVNASCENKQEGNGSACVQEYSFASMTRIETDGEVTLKSADGADNITINGLSLDVKKYTHYPIRKEYVGGTLASVKAKIAGETLEVRNVAVTYDYYLFNGQPFEKKARLAVSGIYNLNNAGWISISTPKKVKLGQKDTQFVQSEGEVTITGDHEIKYTLKPKGKIDKSYDGTVYKSDMTIREVVNQIKQ